MRKIVELVKHIEKHAEVVCDICKEATGRTTFYLDGSAREGVEWEEPGGYSTCRTMVEVWFGEMYPEGKSITKRTADICPDCFQNVLAPMLFSEKGVVFVKREDEVDEDEVDDDAG